MPYFVYYLYSPSIRKFYIGKAQDISYRVEEHNKSLEKYTKRGVPWTLIGYVECKSNAEASQLERKFKKAKNPKYVKWYIELNGIIQTA